MKKKYNIFKNERLRYEKMDMRKVAREVRMSKWAEILREQQASGQTIQGWCAGNGIDKQQYHYWKRKLRESAIENLTPKAGELALSAPTFTEISVSPQVASSGTITIHMGEAVVEIGDASPATVETILRVLSAR